MDSDEKPGMKAIEIDSLSVQRLSQMKQQLDEEVGFCNDSMQQLKNVQSKFSKSLESVSRLGPEKEGADILVPLSASLYVPGSLVDPGHVLVSVGAGYYLEKSAEDAEKYFRRRIQHVTKQMDKVQSLGIQKQRIRDAVQEALESKVQQMAATKSATAPKPIASKKAT